MGAGGVTKIFLIDSGSGRRRELSVNQLSFSSELNRPGQPLSKIKVGIFEVVFNPKLPDDVIAMRDDEGTLIVTRVEAGDANAQA